MRRVALDELDALWARHHAEWRDVAQITSQWRDATAVDPNLLRTHTEGRWWEILADSGLTLLVTREYEHLVMALSLTNGRPHISYMAMPHPSGLAVDDARGIIHIASTRNPNQVYELAPVTGALSRLDAPPPTSIPRVLVPVRSRFVPGCLYMHDLAIIGGGLYANAVGHNAVVRLHDDGRYERVWWPRCIETPSGPIFGRNHLQLNSIAAGSDLAGSFFSASTDTVSARRPGHRNFPVDRRGVIFAGASREPMARGLTRPHSARLHRGDVWVDNSGYGELGIATSGHFTPVARLPGWTRGLALRDTIAFVGTSRVIPRFRQYAPGLEVDASQCGLHAVDTRTGQVLGSLIWPYGNQIFAIEAVSRSWTSGFPFGVGGRGAEVSTKALFYSFRVDAHPSAG